MGSTAIAYCVYGGEYYTVSVQAGEEYNFNTCGGSWDTVISLYDPFSGDLLGWDDDGCGAQSNLDWTATFDGLVHVVIDAAGCSNYFGCGSNLYVTWLSNLPGPSNDDCADAIPITCGETVSGSTVGANNDFPGGCGTSISAPGVWYSFEGTDQMTTFDLCGSSYDTKVNVYEGDCNTFNCITGNDDACGIQSIVSFFAFSGMTYYILVQGYGGDTGDFEMVLTCEDYSTTLHQDCGGIVNICDDKTFDGNASDYGDYQDLSSVNSDCLTIEHQSQWFVFSPITPGTIEFTLVPSNGIDYDFAIWGPYVEEEISCPPNELPMRCSYSALYEPTGLVIGAGDTSEPPSGDAWVEAITVNASELNKYYVMLIDNYTADNTSYELNWNLMGVTLNCAMALLPVEWSEFYGDVKEDRNVLYWETTSELNNSHFEIERATDSSPFERIGEIWGQGTTLEPTQYLYNDRERPFGTAYYRLKQVDLNGEFEYSETIALEYKAEGTLLALFPNPGKGFFKAQLQMQEACDLTVEVTGLGGRLLWSGLYSLSAGQNDIQIDLNALSPGTFIIDFKANGISFARERLMRKKS